ncbi:MAG: hypothetical protein H7A35_09710 [Planctomycetales bacterium]|nr:hypothetical protein [bacterium]UNM07153.1 MAG: hypothetical protein H7A35_09710 [Planctomycetales bacterium]
MQHAGLSSSQLSFWLSRLSRRDECIRSMGRLMGWYELAVDPLLGENLLRDPLATANRLAWLREQLNLWLAGADERNAAQRFLCFLELTLLPVDPDGELQQELLDCIDSEAQGEQSALMQSYVRVVLAGMLGEEEQYNITHGEFQRLMQQVPSGRSNLEMWHAAAQWAYRNAHSDVLEQALEFCVMGYPGAVDEQAWRMTNLMYRLHSGRAISQDVECLIHCFDHPAQLERFREVLLSDCDEAGLMSREMQYWLDRRDNELRRQQLQVAEDVRAAG